MRYIKRIAQALTAGALAVALTAGIAFASVGTAVVTADSLRMRKEPNTSSAILASVRKGSTVELLSREENGWYKVIYQGKEGYMSGDWLDVTMFSNADTSGSADASGFADPAGLPVPVVTADTLNVRSDAGTDYDRVGTLKKGTEVTILETLDGWYKISSGELTGYVSADYISLDGTVPQEGLVLTGVLNVRSGPGTDYERLGTVRMGTTVTILNTEGGWYKVSTGSLTGYVSADYVAIMDDLGSSPLGAAAAALAISLVGSRYVYGAEGPSTFDCSGLTYYIYKQLGRPLSRGSSGQYRNNGSFVPASQVEPGDLVFFFDPRFDGSGGTLPTTHMGICVGNGKFIHASTTTYRVQYDDLYGSYYTPYIVGFKRIS